jgi:hypothetical protein
MSNCQAEEWIRDPPFNFSGEILSYYVIPLNINDNYIELLSNSSYYIIENEDYTRITNKVPSKKYVIATRAVYSVLGGNYRVIQNNNTEISIRYYVLGGRKEIHKSVLLVEVDSLPKKIYVSATTIR